MRHTKNRFQARYVTIIILDLSMASAVKGDTFGRLYVSNQEEDNIAQPILNELSHQNVGAFFGLY
jgi:hypothetical protein